MGEPLKVLIVAAEAVPFAKVGGLAEYASALPKALRELGVDARLIIPRYADSQRIAHPRPRHLVSSMPVPMGGGSEPAQLLGTEVEGVPVYLIYNDQHFGNRDRVYGFNDDPQRFLYFSRAVIASMAHLNWVPDVVHTNDWHSAPVTTWLSVYGRDDAFYKDMASLFTIHNLAYQGVAGRLLLNYGQMNAVPHLSVEPPGKVNWMAQGIAHADVVSTVSPTYAAEISRSDLEGLGVLLAAKRDRFFGILSGIDTTLWDPEQDSALAQTFGADTIAMRSVNKTALQRELHLPADVNIPLMGFVARLDPMKGLALMADSLSRLLESRECQFVLLGSGDDDLAAPFQALQDQYSRNIRVLLRFDDRLARRIYAGADLLIAPSEMESVSVGLMAGMRYGAVPIVRGVGGLVDTVTDIEQQPGRGTGFVFDDQDVTELQNAIVRAFAAMDDKRGWQALQKRIMSRDFSWGASARAYEELYQRAIGVHTP
jgi:starch synthase